MWTRRQAMLGAAAMALPASARAEGAFDAVVTTTPQGEGSFASLGAAVAAAPTGPRPYRIRLTRGMWRERVVIDRPNVILIGAGQGESVLVSNRAAGDIGADGKPVGTFGTATLTVTAPGFSARNLTIANDFDYVAHLPKPNAEDKTGGSGAQAVALAIQGEADRSLLDNIRLIGHQDTLYVDAGRSLFRGCMIEGSVDFIFGSGRAFFDDCTILSRLRPGQDFNGYIAAPSTAADQPYGFVFNGCRLEKEPGVAPRSVALGRPWRRTRTFPDGHYGDPGAVGACAYIDCWMDDHIITDGWMPMGYGRKDGRRAMLQPEEVRFFEYASSGPGAGKASPRRRFLSVDQSRGFDSETVLQGWRN